MSLVRFSGLVLAALLGGIWAGMGFVSPAAAQSPSAEEQRTDAVIGRPVVRTISPQAYDGNGQVNDIVQGEQGLLYIASSYGLQQYDGARWRYLRAGDRETPEAIARDSAGTLYVGGDEELGRYRPDSLGRLRYHSLMPHVPDTHRPVGTVLRVATAGAVVFFDAKSGVLRWSDGRMQAVTDTTAQGLFACRGRVYHQAASGDLQRIDGTTLERVAGGERFRETTIRAVLPGRGRGCEVVTAEQGRFTLTDTGTERRPLPGGPMEEPVVSAVRGPDGAWAVATRNHLRLIGPNGTRYRLTQDGGALPGPIRELYLSRRVALWVATEMGLTRVAWPDPVTVATQPPSLQSVTGAITRHEGRLVLGTEDGLWRVGPDAVRRVATTGVVHNLLSTRAGLLGAGADGLFVVRDGRVRSLLDDAQGYALHRSRRDSSVVYATTFEDDLLRLRRDDGRWRVVDRTDRVGMLIPTLGQSPDGTLWLGTGLRGLYRLSPPLDDLEAAPMAEFDTTDGLPRQNRTFVTQLGDSVRFSTPEGLYRVENRRFGPDPRFRPVYADGVRWSWFAERGPDGGVWIDFGGHKLGVATGWPGDSLRWTERPFRRVADIGDVWTIYPDRERDSLVWFGAEGALVRYDRTLQRFGEHNQPVRTLVRGVQTGGDSLLYGGDTDASSLPSPVGYAHNRLRFQFGSTSFEQIEGPTHNWDRPRQYRWRLAGFDENWSDWTTEPRADYTGLPPGDYTMRVEVRTLYRVVGQEAALSFTVLPPWYRTWWAYGGYALLALGLVAGAVQWRTRQLRRRQEALEETVAERTEEIRRKNDELARQAEKLKELDEAKSRFFANVSHEFRTPLTLIRGPVQAVRERLRRTDVDLDDEAEQLAVVERNTDRLRRLVDQLLALARLDAGSYELAACPLDLGAETRRIARSFEPLAERHGLAFTVDGEEAPDGDAEPVVVDRAALEHVLGNLLSNAIKFTPEGGRIEVTVTETREHVAVAVADTGPGIPDEKQDAVFDRFAQVQDGPTGDQDGLGIGLAFARDLVEQHGGTVTLDSTQGEGTTITVRFPCGTDHLTDDQVAAPRPAAEATPTDTPEEQRPPPAASPSPTLDPRPSSSSSERTEAPGTTPPPGEKWKNDPDDQSQIVLVVDDNADVRRYVRSVLVPDYTVIEAADGEEGLEQAREAAPDCILADVMMPRMDGVTMTRHLKSDRTTDHIPVVMLTARAGPEHEIEGLEAGADDYVTKPFDADVLRARVAGMIEVRRRLRRRIRTELERQRGDGEGALADDATGDQAPDTAPPRLVVPTASEDEPEFVGEVRAAIEAHLADSDLSVEQLAGDVAVSRSTLYRRLKEQADATPSQFVRRVRVEHGARLLREREGTVSEVAYAVGFESLSYFSRQFREQFGQSPSEYVEAVG